MFLEDGAYLKGSIDIVRTEASKPVAKSQTLSLVPALPSSVMESNLEASLPN
jgi:hypothetical protein